ncbi:insulinase family protein [Citreicella sp. C3M06]|uniref:M16 family metallopeptidase n=1 Tax=Citreicella sp. C3M06 TaxID=2841564 RepID=UPI001C098C58|nr:pitrilysin family protein [Citreicella sp. C3M06]MBU2962907.1 insulinase family protein [Citreicella sp. C3M06]
MLKCAAALAAALLTALPLHAQDSAPQPAAVAPDQVTSFTLDNGLQVVVIEDHRAPVVTHMVWYRAGSADETAGRSGVAHFLEHLLFKGTDTLAPGEFSKTVAANGGNDNAFTSYDQTAYFQNVAADRLGLMMKMEADRMVNLRLDEGDIATERQVIIEERNMRVENDPSALMREQMSAAMFMNSRYGVPIIGWRPEMETLDLAAAYDFYHRNYAPNNAIVIVAGDVTPDEVHRLAEQYYGPLPPNPELDAERIRPQEPPQLAERRLSMSDPRVAQPYVMRRYLAPERDAGDQRAAAALTLLAQVLSGGQTSVLTRALQFDSQTAIYTSAWYNGTSYDDTDFGLVVVPAPGVTLEQAEAQMDEVLARFLSDGVDEEQLDRIKFQLRAEAIYERDNVSSLARRYGDALTSGLTIDDIHDWPQILQQVTPEEIVAAARSLFDPSQAVTGYLMPARDAPASGQPVSLPASKEVTQ